MKPLTTEQMANVCAGASCFQEGFSWQEFARKARRFVKMEKRQNYVKVKFVEEA